MRCQSRWLASVFFQRMLAARIFLLEPALTELTRRRRRAPALERTTMFPRMPLALLVLAATMPRPAYSETQCLPPSLFPQDYAVYSPKFDLGVVAGAPTLCAPNVEMQEDQPLTPRKPGYFRCWAVDPANGALSESAATVLPGHAQTGKTDAKGCIEGYCAPNAKPDEMLLWSTSTDNVHSVLLRERTLYVFDASTKEQTKAIPLDGADFADDTNVGNEPIDILYAGKALYVVGTDAGPYIAVWSYKDDGTRTGVIKSEKRSPEESGGFSVYNGAANVIDDSHVALASPGLQSMIVVDAATGARKEQQRQVNMAACTPEEMQSVDIGDYEVRNADGAGSVSAQCHDAVVTNLESYFDIDPLRLPSGDFLAALSGKNRGSLILLDGATLNEKQRFQLPRCSN